MEPANFESFENQSPPAATCLTDDFAKNIWTQGPSRRWSIEDFHFSFVFFA